MASVQDLKRRIRSIRNTRKITKAMELVASARRSFAAATSSIAFVIFRVLRTERRRRLMSWTVAKAYSAAAPTSPASSLTAKLDLNFSISDVSFSWKSSERSFCSRISS